MPENNATRCRAYYLANREKALLRAKRWAQANPEKARLNKRAYRNRNRAQVNARERARHAANLEQSRTRQRERNRRWRERHPEHYLALSRSYYKPEVVLVSQQKRRARLRGAAGNGVTRREWRAIKDEYGHRCAYCARVTTKPVMEHVDPLSKGGAHDGTNIVMACARCNNSKYTKTLLFWLLTKPKPFQRAA